MKQNCWEIKKCGREFGGNKSHELGVCPVSINKEANGINGGVNAGRICWAVTGTLCGGKIQGEFAKKQASCMNCEVFKKVHEEEGAKFNLLLPGQVYRSPIR